MRYNVSMEYLKKQTFGIRILHTIYFLVLIAMFGYAIFGTDLMGDDRQYGWSDGWQTSDGRLIDTDDICAGSKGMIITKQLPESIESNDSLCFVADNINYTVYVNDDAVTEFTSGENLTGKGYGNIRVSIPLLPSYAGGKVTIELGSVFDEDGEDEGGDGRISDMCICPEKSYANMLLTDRLLPALLSLVIIFFGVLLSCIYFAVPRKDLLPFNMAALGMIAILLGLWCFNQTGFIQLITGKTIGFRVLTYLLVIFVEYPTLVFVNSYTIQKNALYTKIVFAFWLISVASLLVLRFVFNIDMHKMLPVFSFSYAVAIAFFGYIIVKDISYCRAHCITRRRRYFVTGAICFAACSAVEIVSYVSKGRIFDTEGNFLRIGLCLFFFEMLMQFLYWWSGEQEGKEQLIRFGFNDLMTGAGNRRAFEQFEQTELDKNGTYGYVMCDINGLKQVNDREGHEAGDSLIMDVAACLIEVFGEKRVYRMGGDEFVAISFTDKKDDFAAMIHTLREKLTEKHRSASIGDVFVECGSMDYGDVKKTADKLMYDEKERFYQGRNERRRRG